MIENTRYYWNRRDDPGCRAMAQECAKDAAPYMHPRLNAVSADVHTTLTVDDDPIDELLAEIDRRRQALRNSEDNDSTRH
jgi:hypothetical protein